MRRLKSSLAWLSLATWTAVLLLLRPAPALALAGIAVGTLLAWRAITEPRSLPLLSALVWMVIAITLPHESELGFGRFFADQTYHHQVLRALNHAAVHGADVSEVLQATTHVRAGDTEGWYAAWTALGDRNRVRARTIRDAQSRGRALLRAHAYYLRAEFFLSASDPRRASSSARNRAAFYQGLDTLGLPYERLSVPYGSHHLNALYYPQPADAPARTPLLLFCGGSDTTVEELYFFLAAAAHERGYAVLTFEGPGQGAVLREQQLIMTPAWEKPTSAVLDTFLAGHAAPQTIVMVGLSLGGYLAARAAAFEPRIRGVVSYDIFDGHAVAQRGLPLPGRVLRAWGLDGLVDVIAPVFARFNPAAASALVVGGTMLGTDKVSEIADALEHYRLSSVASRVKQDVLLFAGEDDQFVPVQQLEELRRTLVHARSVTTKVYDRASGGSEHSQLGATTLWQADLFEWLNEKFPDAPAQPRMR